MIIMITKNNYLKSNDSSCWFTTGFTDAEGCFYISITRNTKFKTGWKVLAFFEIHIHKKDVELLEFIQKEFNGVGRIVPNGKNACSFRVNSINDLLYTIIPHFEKYPLTSQKYADFVLWKQAIIMMKKGKHLTDEGLKEIVNIRASINRGLSEALKQTFTQTIAAVRPINTPIVPHEAWLSGFTSGEGSFLIRIGKSKDKVVSRAQLVFTISQHIRDELLLKSIINYLNCGNYRVHTNRDLSDYICSDFEGIYTKIIPFFKQYPILGVKSQDFNDWVRAAGLIKNKDHLTPKGLDLILTLKSGMNRNRIL
nr:hypothetical protein [Cordyceps militaris]